MAWPPAYSSAFIGSGATTIRWGTDQMLVNANQATTTTGSSLAAVNQIGSGGTVGGGVGGYYTIESMRPADDIENIYIEQGSGLRATRIQLFQGRNITFTVVDDTNMFHPSPASLVTVIDAMSGNLLTFKVINNSYNANRKTEGKREITAEYLTLIEGNGTIPPI